MAGSVNQNSRFDLGARKLFFVPPPKIVLQQYRPTTEVGQVRDNDIHPPADQIRGKAPAVGRSGP
jgi:hypothetical protein